MIMIMMHAQIFNIHTLSFLYNDTIFYEKHSTYVITVFITNKIHDKQEFIGIGNTNTHIVTT